MVYLETLPSSPPLQGGRGFNRSSPKFSSLEGVWQLRKGEKMRERGKREKWNPNFIYSKNSSLDSVYKNGLCSLTKLSEIPYNPNISDYNKVRKEKNKKL